MVVVFGNPFISFAVTLWTLASVLPVSAGRFEDAEAAVNIGDYATALPLLGTLADQDNTYAERLLGIMYIKGRGVPQDYAMGMRWMRIAANKGLADAQNEVGILFQRGWGVERNEAEAVKWFRLAADQGLVLAQNNLADTYALGLGVPQDFGEAFRWYHLAADQSSSYAENVIGIAYEHGLSVGQDYAEAFRWYRRAANKIYERPGDTWIHSPQYNIGAMYASGRGTAQDNVQALMWFTLAAAFGDTKPPGPLGIKLLNTSKYTALEQRDRLMALMTSAQITEAERLAREWRPHPIVTIERRAK
ncbi:tetratricopeptide repeat protein [Bradyrhizobium sp.]|uniref:tetratricopeptide repeat protein n=1 Tax=Bradyrhizobium sp. TaxID=376 RepID=UPI003C760C95